MSARRASCGACSTAASSCDRAALAALRALTDQLRVFDTQAVTDSLGRLTGEEMGALDDALALIFGLRL